MENTSEIIFYQGEDGQSRLEVRLEGETVWLSLNQLTELFQKSKSTISEHLKNVFEEGELVVSESTVRKFRTVQTEGNREVVREIEFFSLDVIISIGYRVKSHRGTQFRIWATQQLREYIVKGFLLDDKRFKSGHQMNYFDELLNRIRDIRSSERVFYQKIKDIYTTSIDYDPQTEATQMFFKVVQNKLLWAVSEETAAELIKERSNSELPHMGLTTWSNAPEGKIRKTDVTIAKNYLNEEEIQALNLLVEQFLAFAESQALQRKPMYMKDWIEKLDGILSLNDRSLLDHAGKISREIADSLAETEYDKFKIAERQKEKQDSLNELEADLKKLRLLVKRNNLTTKSSD